VKDSRGFWCRKEAEKVSRETGLSPRTVLDYWKLGKTPKKCIGFSSYAKTDEVNLSLAVMATLNEPGQNQTLKSIAEVCGISKEAIRSIEQKALRNIRRKVRSLDLEEAFR
jgi:hypothetical protein